MQMLTNLLNLTKSYNDMVNLFFILFKKIIKFNLSTKCMQKLHVFMKHYAPGGNKVQKAICLLYFYHKGQSQGHKVIDLGII